MERYEKVNKDIHRREIQLDTSHEVVMANKMILYSASNLSLNEMKLLRYIIMQTKKGDDYLFEYDFSVKDFAKDADISVKDVYRDFRKMSRHMMQEVLEIEDKKNDHWRLFHWVDMCDYYKGVVTIKISDELKPFLLHLVGSFTRYELDEIIKMNSTYAIRIYEILRSQMDDRKLPYADHKTEISISMDVLRKATNTEKKFERYSSFKTYVIDKAVKEINRCSKYHVTAEPYKRGKAVVGFDFLIESQAGHAVRTSKEDNKSEQIPGQLSLFGSEQSIPILGGDHG